MRRVGAAGRGRDVPVARLVHADLHRRDVRLVADKLRGKPKTEAESETSPGVLLASGYIAGGPSAG